MMCSQLQTLPRILLLLSLERVFRVRDFEQILGDLRLLLASFGAECLCEQFLHGHGYSKGKFEG